MLRQRLLMFLWCLAAVSTGVFSATAQTEKKSVSPDLSVVGVKLGNRATAKAFLEGFQPRIGADGRPTYYFYNKQGNQVMKLTGASFNDRFMIVEIEVYGVDKNYNAPHFQDKKDAYFMTENKLFIGYRQSTASAIIGIPNIDGKDTTGPKSVIRLFGEPASRAAEGKNETLVYKLSGIELADENGQTAKYEYTAQYEFYKGNLQKYILKISPAA